MERALSPTLFAVLLAALALGFYLPTWCPVSTWAHAGEDGPELEAAGRTLGVPHPTGYPLLMLLIRVVGVAVPPPLSALNLLTLVAAAAAVAATGLAGRSLANRVLASTNDGSGAGLLAGLLAALLLAVSLTWWKQAVIGEVYTLHVALLAATLALIFDGGRRRRLLAAYFLGLGMAHHLQTLPFLAALLLYLGLSRGPRLRLAHVALFLLPISLYLTLLVRSRLDPPFDWGNPETLENLWWMVSGAPYRGNLLREGLGPALERWGHALITHPTVQLGHGGAALAAAGLVVAARRRRPEAALLGLLFVGTTLVAAAYAIPDPAAYYLPATLALALAGGIGGAALIELARRAGRALGHQPWRLVPLPVAAAFLVASIASRAITTGREADASGDHTGHDYATLGIAALEPGALVVAHGDGRTFSLWYGAQVLSSRSDTAILYDNLIDWPWYRTLTARRHPGVRLPPPGMSLLWRQALLIAGHVEERPVYVTELAPELDHLFVAEPAGPLFRVRRRPPGEPDASAPVGVD